MSNSRKASSVEWFAKKVKDHCDRTGEAPTYHQIGEWQKEAKVRHRKEIVFAHLDGAEGAVETINKYASVSNTLNVIYSIKNGTDSHEEGEEYYNKTFNND